MNLYQLECPLNFMLAEELSSFLEEDAISTSFYELEPERWMLQVLVEASKEAFVKDKMAAFFQKKDFPFPDIMAGPLPQEDWVAAVYQGFPPLVLGRFYIYGSHIQEMPPPGLIPLKIDAATAFGSGQHESTEGCLKALTALAEEHEFKAPLDMGCGSGILALAMARLWEAPILACDNDPEAVRVTLENARINRLENLIEACVSEGFSSIKNKTFDLMAANILAGPLCQMAGDAAKSLQPGGYIVLAGLLNRQAEDVIDAYRSVGTKFVDQLFIGDWSTLIMRKENDG